jgi:hypothetical protein
MFEKAANKLPKTNRNPADATNLFAKVFCLFSEAEIRSAKASYRSAEMF